MPRSSKTFLSLLRRVRTARAYPAAVWSSVRIPPACPARISLRPPTSWATTGVPTAMDSSGVIGIPSWSEHMISASRAARHAMLSGLCP